MIDQEKVKHLALLARLKLSEAELEKLTSDLEKILNYVRKIEEINLEEYDPLINLLEAQRLREDEVSSSSSIDLIKQNFPEEDNGYLRVPKIL